MPFAGLAPEIVFDAVVFAYPGGRRAAHTGLSFRIGAGERVAIVGPSGAGKSTIVRLLSRLYQAQSGSIRIGGRDLRDLDPAQVRGMIAVVSQDTYLFHGSVEDNLRLGRPNATHAELVAAATAANAHGFIDALPNGYQTVDRRARHAIVRRAAAALGDRPSAAAGLADFGAG